MQDVLFSIKSLESSLVKWHSLKIESLKVNNHLWNEHSVRIECLESNSWNTHSFKLKPRKYSLQCSTVSTVESGKYTWRESISTFMPQKVGFWLVVRRKSGGHHMQAGVGGRKSGQGIDNKSCKNMLHLLTLFQEWWWMKGRVEIVLLHGSSVGFDSSLPFQ